MKIQFGDLHLLAETPRGQFGRLIEFRPGLNVIAAPNTSGKTLCLMAIPFALGLEGSFGSGTKLPLTQAMTTELKHGEETLSVTGASVFLEVKNRGGDWRTIERQTVGQRDANIIRVWHGRREEIGPDCEFLDYHVRLSGSAVNERGFHRWLAEFVGWDQPTVPTYDGDERPLYLEYLLPLWFIEQKKGWAGFLSQFPNYLRLKQGGQRAIEFILGLKTFELERQKAALEARLRGEKDAWRQTIAEIRAQSRAASVLVEGVPEELPWKEAKDEVTIKAREDGSWRGISEVLSLVEERLATVVPIPVPKPVDDASNDQEKELSRLRQALAKLEVQAQEISREAGEETSEQEHLQRRLSSLETDLRRHQDLIKLQARGATIGLVHEVQDCPICHRHLPEAIIVEGEADSPMMTLEENIKFVQSQIKGFEQMLAASQSRNKSLHRDSKDVAERSTQVRLSIRILKEAMLQPSSIPDATAMRNAIELEARAASLRRTRKDVESLLSQLQGINDRYAKTVAEMKALPAGTLTPEDQHVLQSMQTRMRELLRRFSFETADANAVAISTETYRPEVDGLSFSFDLAREASASDMIRLVWAYLLALMETGARAEGNHPGVLVMDAPQQQEVVDEDYTQLLREARALGQHGGQVVVATSQTEAHLQAWLPSGAGNLLTLDGKALRPMT